MSAGTVRGVGYHSRMNAYRPFALLSAAWLCTWPVQALELPDLGEVARTSFSESQEAQVGREAMRQIRASGDYLDDPVLLDYLNSLGDRLASASSQPERRFEFFVVRDPSINAFALPGGYIGVHTGLISAARNESELAGVLAHEVSHVTQNHIARIVDAQKGAGISTLLALAVAILAARSNSQVVEAALATSQAMSIQSQLNFTREHEREADRMGLQALSAAGFSPQGMASFFERLQTQSRLYESNAPAYLLTHPLSYERIADMQNRLAREPYRQHADSLEYRFVRARVQADEGAAGDAVKRFENRLQTEVAQLERAESHYALARAALRDRDHVRARAAFVQMTTQLTGVKESSPLVPLLDAEIALAENRAGEAVVILEQALPANGAYRPLAYLYVRALLRAGMAPKAQAFIHRQQRFWKADLQFQKLAAECYQAQGQVVQAHLAQAEVYVLQDQVGAAIDQLQLAQKGGDGDFYTLAIVDARLRELKEMRAMADKK